MECLHPARLATVHSAASRYSYDRRSVRPGIVHLGAGAFHRAHQAVYVDDLLAKEPGWGIIGASLKSPLTRAALAPQESLYVVAVRSAAGTSCRIVGALLDVVNAASSRERLIEVMAQPDIRIVSLTVTEKGYCHDPASGELDMGHPDIRHDLDNPSQPISAPGLIVEALRRRRARGVQAFTIMSCDNLSDNGRVARRIISTLGEASCRGLGSHIERDVAFPVTVVDRIVPATSDHDRAEISGLIGLDDAWPVVTEPFRQWIIEDNFPAGRPRLEEAGAILVANVAPFEQAKLRMLNGSHSTIAYLGYLAGFETVADAIAFEPLRTLIRDMMTCEIIPTLSVPGIDLTDYRDALIARFANPALKHRTWQIAMDGSQKLPQRLLATIGDRLRRQQSIDRLCLGVAAWIRYATGVDERGRTIDVRDPLRDRFIAISSASHRDPVKLTAEFLGISEVFGKQLPNIEPFREAVARHLSDLLEQGARGTMSRFAG